MNTQVPARGGRRGRQARDRGEAARKVDYRRLRNPFPQMNLYSDDAIAAMHDAALTALEDLGLRSVAERGSFFVPVARVDDASEMVWIGREMVDAALNQRHRWILCRGGVPERTRFEPGSPPSARRRRTPCHDPSGDAARERHESHELVKMTVFRRAADGAAPDRTAGCADQPAPHHANAVCRIDSLNIFSRGTPQVRESFEMVRTSRPR